jgi:DNA-binding response OmpR family regulator
MTHTTGSPARTVLVVADNADTQAAILEHAKATGHVVICAATPALGLTTFDKAKPDIVVTDLFLPEQDGINLVKQIHERRPTCPIVILTDADHDESTLEGLRNDAFDYVQQPIREDAFTQILQRAIYSLPDSVDDATGNEPIWRLVHILEDVRTLLVKREARGNLKAEG